MIIFRVLHLLVSAPSLSLPGKDLKGTDLVGLWMPVFHVRVYVVEYTSFSCDAGWA